MSRIEKIYIKTEEVILKKKSICIEVEMDFFQIFKCVLQFLGGMSSGVSYDLFLYLSSITNKDNAVEINEILFEDFRIKCKRTDLSRATFTRSVEELVKNKVLLKMTKRRYYKLNPMIVWSSTIESRKSTIAMLEQGQPGLIQLQEEEAVYLTDKQN